MPHSPQDFHKKILGRKGEKLVEKFLTERGYKLLKRNFRTPFGEADLIMQDGDEIVFVEVKTRLSEQFGAPKEAVGREKQKRYYQIALCYGKEEGSEPNARFDVAEVYEGNRIEYYKNAF